MKNPFERAVNALLAMGPVKHEKIPKPTKADMDRKFKLRTDRRGKPSMEEVK